MHRSWSMPVAQALQRHSGGWSHVPTPENAKRDDPRQDASGAATPTNEDGRDHTVAPAERRS
jgi:hypothetical protein